nr:O-antigen translocase [Acidithiobacillus thiooxidans]
MRSSSIMGGSQIINIATRLVKMKVVAVLLGPAGIGFIGLYQNLIQTASSVASLGLNSAGTRQIAKAQAEGGDTAVSRTRQALLWGTSILALIGSVIFWLASDWIARHILADEHRANDVAWLSIGVALTVAVGSQEALLVGLRQIGDIARINVGAGVLGTILGIPVLWLWGIHGLVAMVLIVPAVTFLFGHFYVKRLVAHAAPPFRLSEIAHEWRELFTLGSALMVSGLVMTSGLLLVRTLVQQDLGVVALGQFQASWIIGMTYLGFVLGAMGTDYYPRLTAVIHDANAANRLINEQTEVALLLCAPILLAMLGLAPWVIYLLYSADFAPAAEILRWQLLGDIFKVMSWPLGYVILAKGAGKTFVTTETIYIGVFVLASLIGLPLFGVTATGIAYVMFNAVGLPIVWILARRSIGFRWIRAVKVQALAVFLAAVAVDIVARWSEPMGAILGTVLATVSGIWALMRLSTMAGLPGDQIGRIGYIGSRFKDKVKEWMDKIL